MPVILGTGDHRYEVVDNWAKLPPGRLTALRVEALPDDSLPGRGSGRAGHGNFVLSELVFTVTHSGGGVRPHEVDELQAAIDEEAGEIVRCVGELQELGLLVKDLDEGLLDFPTLRDGEEALLCWRLGEEEVGFWHSLEDGFAGRKPLP